MDSESDCHEVALEDILTYSQESGEDDGPRMDSESDCDEDSVEDTLTYFQESGEDHHDDLEDTFSISHFQPESEPDSKVNSIRFYSNPNYQSNQMRRMMSENPINICFRCLPKGQSQQTGRARHA
jgi:hypothetical protein